MARLWPKYKQRKPYKNSKSLVKFHRLARCACTWSYEIKILVFEMYDLPTEMLELQTVVIPCTLLAQYLSGISERHNHVTWHQSIDLCREAACQQDYRFLFSQPVSTVARLACQPVPVARQRALAFSTCLLESQCWRQYHVLCSDM